MNSFDSNPDYRQENREKNTGKIKGTCKLF